MNSQVHSKPPAPIQRLRNVPHRPEIERQAKKSYTRARGNSRVRKALLEESYSKIPVVCVPHILKSKHCISKVLEFISSDPSSWASLRFWGVGSWRQVLKLGYCLTWVAFIDLGRPCRSVTAGIFCRSESYELEMRLSAGNGEGVVRYVASPLNREA